MGRSNTGVGIKTNTNKLSLDKVVKNLFGEKYHRTTEKGDIRKKDWLFVSKTKDYLHIQNADYTEQFFTKAIDQNIDSLNKIFKYPDLILAYEQYDSGGTYSYAIVKHGQLRRQFRSISYETHIDQGELEPVENEWKSAEVKEFDLGDGEKEIILSNTITGETCDKGSEPELILNSLLYSQLKIEDPDFPTIECSFYKKSDKTEHKWHESIFIGTLQLVLALFISFKGLTNIFGEEPVSEFSSKNAKFVYALIQLESTNWRFLLVLFLTLIGVYFISEGLKKKKAGNTVYSK